MRAASAAGILYSAMRRSYVQMKREDGSTYLVEKSQINEYVPDTHFVQGDLAEYESPIDGHVVSGRKQRREDLARNNCRPYEKGEIEDAKRRARDADRAFERKIEERLRWFNA